MESMVENQLDYYENGFKISGWGTQYYSNNKFQPGVSGYDFYDGLQGNMLCTFFYSQLFDSSYLHLFEHYLDVFNHFLNKGDFNDSESSECGAFGIIGGGIFVLSTITGFKEQSKVSAGLSKLLSEVPRIVEKNVSLDFIYGITGLLRRLIHVRQVTQIDVMPEIMLCIKNINIGKLKEMKFNGYAHGSWAVYDILMKGGFSYSEILDDLTSHKMADQSESKKVNGRWLHSWCNGTMGELELLLTMYNNGHYLVEKEIIKKYKKVKDSIFLNGDKYPIGLCHGMFGFTDITYAMKSSGLLSSLQHEVVVDHITNRWLYKRYTDYQISSNGMMLGRLGIAYQLMRMYTTEKIPSVLM